jgi:CBS domain-containing protein
MSKVTERLVASALMQRDIVATSPSDTLRDALTLMTENHITGLPVMDDKCRCIGLITASDILNYEVEHSSDSEAGSTTQFFDPETQQWESMPLAAFSMEEFGDVPVSDVMARNLISVERDTPLKEVAQRMIDERVHRVLVLDKHSNLYGIISAYDFVRLVAEG